MYPITSSCSKLIIHTCCCISVQVYSMALTKRHWRITTEKLQIFCDFIFSFKFSFKIKSKSFRLMQKWWIHFIVCNRKLPGVCQTIYTHELKVSDTISGWSKFFFRYIKNASFQLNVCSVGFSSWSSASHTVHNWCNSIKSLDSHW